MTLEEIDWNTLDRLRSRFLSDSPAATAAPYWLSEDDLRHYHHSFAARIGWKWDNALESAARSGFKLTSRRLLDWGCGSGIAALRALDFYGADAFDEILLWDHSIAACRFAQKTIREAHPQLSVEIAPAPQTLDAAALADTAVLVSHALTELSETTQAALEQTLRHAAAVLVVEPGTHAASRKLAALRDKLADDFHIAAPCTHCKGCPLFEAENAHHWCHFFGKPPIEAFTETFWTRFAQAMEIDLRALPYSMLFLSKTPGDALPDESSRLIGRPRQFKGYTRILSCDTHGLRELELQKRDDKQLWKSLKKETTQSLYTWKVGDDGRIASGHALEK